MRVMKKWQKVDEVTFGDFPNDDYQYGVMLESDSQEYTIGRFKNRLRDGLAVTKIDDDTVIFGKYSNDDPLYPSVTVGSDIIIVELGEFDGKRYYISFFPYDSTILYDCDDDVKKEKKYIIFDGKTGEIRFLDDKETKYEPVPRHFIPDRPIVHSGKLNIPDVRDFNKFEFRTDSAYAVCENSLNDKDPGIGVITWDDGEYCVGGWLDNTRNGYQIYQTSSDDHFFFFFGRVDIGGIYVKAQGDDVIIKSCYSGKRPDNSYILKFNKGVLTYSDYSDLDSTSQSGIGLQIKDLDTVSFVNFVNGTAYEVNETFHRVKENKQEINNQEHIIESGGDVEVNIKKNIDKNDPEYKIMNLIGQANVKVEFARIKAYLMKNDAASVYTNMFFTGGNGVGKSTVARLFTEMLYKYGSISENRYVEVSAKELVSAYDGNTTQLIYNVYNKRAKGCVLFIDDVRYLTRTNNSGVREGLNTLVKIMRDDPKTTIILSDNKFNIDDLYNNNIEDLQDKIRFRIDFVDFTREELKEILKINAGNKGYLIDPDALQLFLDVIFLAKSYGSEINATTALAMLEEIIVIQNVRTLNSLEKTITVEDVNAYIMKNDLTFIDAKTGGQSDARKKLDELIGLEDIKETVDDLISYFAMNRGKKVDCHMCFYGNPGTGKTEVARILGKLLRQEGILPTSKFVEVTRRDLVAEYIGQSAIRTRDVIDKAMGGVLYIDEAYSLSYGGEKDFGREVIAELLKAMEDRRGEFIVILAGYTNEMKKLFEVNPGFYSRVKFNLEFQDYNEKEFSEIAKLFIDRDQYVMSDENIDILVKIVCSERNKPNFANARTLREYLSRIEIKHASRLRKAKIEEIENNRELLLDDIIAVFGEEVVNEVKNGQEEIVVPKLDPNRLRELYKNYPSVPFLEHKDLVEEVVVAIRTRGPESGESSGFFITDDGYIATCAHCVKGSSSIEVRRRINHRGKRIDIYYEADIVSMDVKNDVAVIKVRCKNPDEKFDFVALADPDYILPPLSEIYEMGYPFGVSRFDEMTVNVGKIGSYQKGRDGQPDQINLDISAHGGNSGSLIVDAKTSRVIGTLTGASLSPHGELIETIIFCRPISYIWAMLEKDFNK